MEKVSLNILCDKLDAKYDVFIASASFEDRALSITKSILPHIEFKHKFVIAGLNNRECVQKSLNEFTNEYHFEVINADSLDQLSTLDNFIALMNVVLSGQPDASFLIDITTFTRQNLLILVRLLRNNLSKTLNKVQCLYSVASDYAIGLAEDEKWLSEGVLDVHSVFGYVGSMIPSKPYHLIIMMGYEVERAASLIYAYEPSKITIGFASQESSLSETHYELNKKRFDKLREDFPNAEQFEFSCSNVETVEVLLHQAAKHPEYNVVITPMNNKVSTLFLAAASFENKDIQVAIAVPMLYNYEGYSSPGDSCLIINANELLLKENSNNP